MTELRTLPVPDHFDPDAVARVWPVPYQARAAEGVAWAARHQVSPSAADTHPIVLLAVDVQNTFCLPEFELYVAGRSGTGAVDDVRRLCRFIYRNLASLNRIVATLDTHRAMQVFHAVFLVDAEGRHPEPYTIVSVDDVLSGRWRFNESIAAEVGFAPEDGQRHLEHYVRALEAGEKFALTIWPYHSMLGGIGHALVPAFEEAMAFHGFARRSQPWLRIKGEHPLTEHYSVLGPEVVPEVSLSGSEVLGAGTDAALLNVLVGARAVIVAGQAKSHCVAWTIADLLAAAESRDPAFANRLYLLEDCMSSVVVPGVVDFTEATDQTFEQFAAAGAHRVRSTDPMQDWPGPIGGR